MGIKTQVVQSRVQKFVFCPGDYESRFNRRMNEVCSWLGNRQQEQRTLDTMVCRRGDIPTRACVCDGILIYDVLSIVRAVESITILLIRNGPLAWTVLLDMKLLLFFVAEERQEKRN